jgi:hypothetical protein
MSLEQNVQQWVSIDNQIKLYSDKLKELRDKKNDIGEHIHSQLESNGKLDSTIKIPDGQLKLAKTKETQTLTFKYLETCLSEIIKNEEQVKKIVEYIKNKREVKYISEIRRIYN